MGFLYDSPAVELGIWNFPFHSIPRASAPRALIHHLVVNVVEPRAKATGIDVAFPASPGPRRLA